MFSVEAYAYTCNISTYYRYILTTYYVVANFELEDCLQKLAMITYLV
jgi:hypothetical protein